MPAAPRVSVLPSSPARGALALSPLNARRWRNFKKNRRGYWSLWLFLCLFIITLFAEFISNDKPIIAVYKERGDRLASEANQCIGSDVGFIGASQVTVDIDPSIVQDNSGTSGTGSWNCPDCGWVQPVIPVSPTL